MQANSSTATGSSRRSQTSDSWSSRSTTADPSSSRRRRDRVPSTTSTTFQKSTGKLNTSRGANVPSNSEPPTLLFQDLSLSAPRPLQSKRHLYQRRQESSTTKQNSTVTGIRAASLPDHLYDTRLQERLEEEGLADIEEDERFNTQRRIVSVAVDGTSKELRFTSLAVSASTSSQARCSPGRSSEPQEEDIDELSSMSISETNSFRTILAQELRALHDGTRSPKLVRSPPPPPRSPTSSPESVIFDIKEVETIQPSSFLWPKPFIPCPEEQGLSLGLEGYGVRTEGSSANPLLDSVEAAKPPSLLHHAYRSEISLCGQEPPSGDPSDALILSPRPLRWISPPKPVPALHGPPSIPYARCPSGAEGEDYGGNLHAHDLVWPAYQERVLRGASALHPDYVAVLDHNAEERHVNKPDVVVLVDANLVRGNQVKGRNKSGQPHNRLSRPLMDATNPQRSPRAPLLHTDHEGPQLGPPAWRTPPSRFQGGPSPSPVCHPRDLGLMDDRTVTSASPRPTVYAEPMRPPSPLRHSQYALHREDREHATPRRSHPNHRSTRRDTRPAFIQQAIIDQEKRRLQLEEQELKRRLDEEYRRLGQDHAGHLWENVNTLARDVGDFRYKGETPPVQQHDPGLWTFNHWTYSTTTPTIQNLHVPQMVTHSTHGYSLGVGNLIPPPRPFPYISNSPIARHSDTEYPRGTAPVGLDTLPIFSPSNFTHCTSHNAAPDFASPIGPASPYNNPSCYLPSEPVVNPSFQEQSLINVKPSGPNDGRLAPLSRADRTANRSRLTVRPIAVQKQDGDPTTLLVQDQSQTHVAHAAHRKSATLPRLNSRRANVLQPIATRLSNVSLDGDYLRSTTAPRPQTSSTPRRQTYAETLGKGLRAHPNIDGLPTPPGSSVSDSVPVSCQDKYTVLPPTPPALEPNALSLAWSEPLLEQLPSSWHTSDDGVAPHSASSTTNSTTNAREVRHRRRNRRKGSNAVPAGGL
ncbi:hypothetical protein M407DRAFT_30796 [Tulasnella calospora MUT 4182]|uniref:Uncharacterized protein n=1 Tax=Tulasnella calospora MUT 4182 TaxID=1051891 RepID=A0A0C3LDM0_9AGAM|nr:hypothetical protein M407DRAFT_30796 [Tulasnella calospora MUT 4182]